MKLISVETKGSMNLEQEQQEFTVCTQCAHFKNLEPGSCRKDIWYNHKCMAFQLDKERDPYDGKLKPVSHNDLGMKYFESDEYAYCRDINKGDCERFQAVGG